MSVGINTELCYIGNQMLANILYIILFLVFTFVVCYIYYKIVNDNTQEKKLIKEFRNFTEGSATGFKYSHIAPQEYETEIIDKSKNKSFILYGASDSGKITFLKFYLGKHNINNYIAFVRDAREWDSSKFSSLSIFSKVKMENLHGNTVILDEAGHIKNLKQRLKFSLDMLDMRIYK